MSVFKEYTHLIQSLEVYPRLHYFNKRYTNLKEKFIKFTAKYSKILPGDLTEAPKNYFENGIAVKVIGKEDIHPNVFVATEPHLYTVQPCQEDRQLDYIVPVNPFQDKVKVPSASSKTDLKSSEHGSRADVGSKSPHGPEITVVILNVTVESLNDEGLERMKYLWNRVSSKKEMCIHDFFLLCSSKNEFSAKEEKEFRRKIECFFVRDCRPRQVVIGTGTVEIKNEISLLLESKLVKYFVTVQSILQPYAKGKKGNYSTAPLLGEETVARQIKGFLENGLGLSSLEQVPVSEKGKRYTDSLINRLSRILKCAVILPLSEKYNIPVGLCNHVLVKNDFEDNVTGKFSNAVRYNLKKLDQIAERYRGIFPYIEGSMLPSHSIQRKFDFVLTTLQADLADIVSDMERVLSRFAATVRKFLFEISSCLKKSKADIEQIKEMVQRSAATADISVRNEILRMKDVYGVGTVYGELEIHVNSKEAIEVVTLEVRHLLRKNSVFGPFTVRAVEGNVKMLADNHCSYEHGERLECQSRMGTLAGFVEGDDRKLYGLTCAHVVNGQTEEERNVFISDSSRNELILFARSHPHLIVSTGDARRPLIDLAALQVIDCMQVKCCKFLKDDNCMHNAGIIAADTPVQLAGDYVYKHGAVTQCTKGLVCSDDYSILSAEEQGYVILIENYDDEADDDGDVFAQPGDSGSMICAPDENEVYVVKAIGILSAGNFTTAGEETRKYFSFRLVDGLRQLTTRARGVKFNFPKIE